MYVSSPQVDPRLFVRQFVNGKSQRIMGRFLLDQGKFDKVQGHRNRGSMISDCFHNFCGARVVLPYFVNGNYSVFDFDFFIIFRKWCLFVHSYVAKSKNATLRVIVKIIN